MTDTNQTVFLNVLASAFQSPSAFPMRIDREVSRNRKLHSSVRREWISVLHDSARWRRRLWGDIPPSHVDFDVLKKKLEEARNLRGNPPLSKWAGLSMDALARELSYPSFLINQWVQAYGFKAAVSMALSLNETAPVTIRTNVLKSDRDHLMKQLDKDKIAVEKTAHSPWGVHILQRKNLRSVNPYKRGWFEFQDEGSQLAVLESKVEPGQLVVDACTGAGGKALALAAVMKNEGKLIAVDSDARPFEELSKRSKRAGVKMIETQWIAADDPQPLSAFGEKVDVTFLDAPCSAMGTLRRKPWLKWSISKSTLDQFPKKQLSLLRRYAGLVKPGGRILYVTCTINDQENEAVCDAFMNEMKSNSWQLTKRQLRPDVEGTDGFFIATCLRTA